MDYEKMWNELRERLYTDAEQNLDDNLKFYSCMRVTEMMSEINTQHTTAYFNAIQSTRP